MKQADLVISVEEVCRKMGISDATFSWGARSMAGFARPNGDGCDSFEEENRKLKQIVADPSLDKAMLQARRASPRHFPAPFARQELKHYWRTPCQRCHSRSRHYGRPTHETTDKRLDSRKLTIGMPLHNNAATVETAVKSLLNQTHRDFILLISDDGSRDSTAEICERMLRTDSRITFIRQPRNLGYRNFRHLLMMAATPYFMWAAGDDWWSPSFIERCISVLETDTQTVCAVTRCQFYSQGTPVQLAQGTFPLSRNVRDNLWRYLSHPDDNTRMYGIFRTQAAQQSFPEDTFHAYDWAFSAATLLRGNHAEIEEVLLHRDRTPPSRYVELARQDARSPAECAFPVYAMTRWLIRDARIPLDRRILGALLVLNIEKHWEYALNCSPAYARIAGPLFSLWRRFAWRLRANVEQRLGD